ncbi:MAG TPA: SCO2525 family SAM-dependent methyltransferase [Micromonosporaceae bacterium]|nr:SCO2525 family SAM-dependent methyltransferase [Micromonosporaceae bacterium]
MTRALAPSRRRVGAADGNGTASTSRGNAGYPWDDFDPDWYARHNYATLGADDRRILQIVRDFFASTLTGRSVKQGIDVGSGANLYPALSMLPFCERITLWERSAANVKWLKEQIEADYSESWDRFWNVLVTRPRYRAVENPREALREKAWVRNGDLFKLPPRQWDLGTMFFVAESISDRKNEFRDATQRFVGSLRVGAPFAAAFMENSSGYDVGSLRFPAVAVRTADVESCLSLLAHDVRTVPVARLKDRRDGYDGMILALGKAGRAKS